MYEMHDDLALPTLDLEVSLGLKRQSSPGVMNSIKVLHNDQEDEEDDPASPVSLGQRRRIVIRRANTLQPRKGQSNVAHRFDVTKSSSLGLTNPDLQVMVRGRVASVSSKVAAESAAAAASSTIRFAKSPRSSTSCDPIKFKAAAASIKLRLTTFWWWILNQCARCARQAHLTSATRRLSKAGGSGLKGAPGFEVVADECEADNKDYWGPLIGHGDNGHAAKPLFTSFKTEGRVTTSCLWHACRAVTVGCLLIIMGVTMAVLGEKARRFRGWRKQLS